MSGKEEFAAQELTALAEKFEDLARRFAVEADGSRYLTGLAKAMTDCARDARERAAKLRGQQ